jgi:cytochrome bd-type quinol oxidase subunit 2
VVVAIAGLVFINAGRPGWLLDDPARLAPIVWIAAVAVIAKCWLAVYAWRGVAARYRRMYLLIWLAGTASFVTLGSVVWGMVRIYLRLDVDRVHSVVILLALLAVPLARVGLAPSSLTRNRHQ